MKKRLMAGLVAGSLWLTGCASTAPMTVSLPLQQAWFNDQIVHYVTTDVSDQDMAKAMGANYAPRLRDAIPNYPKPPRQKTVIERVYGFPNGEQRNIFPSAPTPVGFESTDAAYSPIWLIYQVQWVNPNQAVELTSEGALLDAEAKGLVNIERTNIVVNCPIVPAP
ncbi:hypothetical protein MAQ5080_01097 [Marinomonas aquimarina]|uniref:DUF7482 domain-containing protein n=1 Tax=Marinomonas aquimarina TaxID=295068 RepID=A0A1A8T7C6_9GAMM|nr:hypothetical protein [Marinomonas aquimarina]SBS28444.1 hypothetical protein MAQ5080_01097 [Marinomonas aquimarina]